MCPAAALPQLAPWLKERGRRLKYCFTAAMDEEIRHAYHLYVNYYNRKAIGSCARKLGLPKWLVTPARRRPRFGSGERAGVEC